MTMINNIHRISVLLAIVLFSALALAATVSTTENSYECVTKEQVTRAADRSRQGISLVCNEAIRQSNLAR